MHQVSYNLYKIGETEILVGSRPDRCIFDYQLSSSIDAILSVTESHIPHMYQSKHQWSPWNEDGKPTPECIFCAVKTLAEWIITLKLKRIYIHCDAGTHRAPTIFGLFLLSYFPDSAREICDGFLPVNRTSHAINPSDPLTYAKTYIDELKWLEVLLPSMAKKESVDSWISSIDSKELAKYRWDREIKVTLPLAIWKTWIDIKMFFQYNLFITPLSRIRDFFHKLFNTKRGKWLKKMGW